MRQSYAKAQRFLVTTTNERDKEDIRKAFRREILLTVGFTEQEVKGIDLGIPDEEFQELVRERLLKKLTGNARQKIINMSELEYYITQGWEFVTILPNNKVVVKLPVVESE
ncbi:hypothetical protein HRbin04_01328 [archaeon HR04]|nr:hypothetical protein HRbin04_01328 [archaeon HR04]